MERGNFKSINQQKTDQTKFLFHAEASDCISFIKFSASGRKLGVATHSGNIIVFHFDSCGFIELKSFTKHGLSMDNPILEFEGDGDIWAGSCEGSISILSLGQYENRKGLSETLCFLSTPHSSPIIRICSCSDYMAVGEARGLVSLWRKRTLLRLISHAGPVVDLCWSYSYPDILAIAGGKTVNCYSVFQGKVIGQIKTENEICHILWSKNTSEIVISTDSSVENFSLCSYPELQMQNCWIGHECTPIFLGICGNGSTLISAANDEFIKVIFVFLRSVLENLSD